MIIQNPDGSYEICPLRPSRLALLAALAQRLAARSRLAGPQQQECAACATDAQNAGPRAPC